MILLLEFEFSSAHFYEQKKWTSEKNQAVFGKCYTPHGHGHNYHLELEVDIKNTDALTAKNLLRSSILKILNHLDHEHLNFRIPYFKEIVPTTENISLYLRDQIAIPAPFELKLLRLFEMDSIFVELTI